jgi:cytokinesis protein
MICLIQGLTSGSDIRARCSIRAQLETAGLLGIFYKVRQWNDDATTRMIRQYEQEAEADRRDLLEEQDRIVLQSMRSPEDVFRALLQMTRGSKASAYLLNSLRHLLLIKEEGDQKVRYFQLIDRLITSIIMNDTPDLGQDFSRAFGTSVSHLIGKFVEQERMDNAFQEVQELRASLAQVTREKFELSEEINRDDLVASLKSQIAELEERLRKSRAATEALTDQMEGMKRDYEARISDLELIIQELFNMLRESHHLEEVQGLNDGPINRNQLIYDLREQWERKKTIRKLEGKHAKRKMISAVEQGSHDEAVEVLKAEKVALGEAQGALKSRQSRALSTSQFMDAPDEQVRAHIEDALSTQADHIVSVRFDPADT